MSTIQSIHTFTEGMDKDTHPMYKSNKSYDHAINLRYIANKQGDTGSLYNIAGSTMSNSIFNDKTYYGSYLPLSIAGSYVIDKYIIVFAYNYSQEFVYRIDMDSSAIVKLYQADSKILGLYNTGHVDIVGKYESPTSIKIYWAVDYRNIRTANIINYFTEDGTSSTPYLAPGRFDIVTDIQLKSPIFNNTSTGGSLQTGKVQYAYSLYKQGGQETFISPPSLPIPLYKGGITAGSLNVLGDSESVNTGKSISLSIDIDPIDTSYFDYLTLYRVHYSSFNAVPTITIINNYKITSLSSIVLVDNGGNGLGTLTVEEFSILSKTFFTASTIDTKNNRLFAGNIKNSPFEVDYDARAYRFRANKVAYIAQDYSATGGFTLVTTSNWDSIDKQHPCVNIEDGMSTGTFINSCQNVYKANGTTIGGEGPNISYEFVTANTVLDNSLNPRRYNSTESYSNELQTVTSLGYQRGEVYRFGIIFYGVKGQASAVKWIGDIRFPSFRDPLTSTTQGKISSYHASTFKTRKFPIGISFYVKNIPYTAKSWQIVRARRTDRDKSIIMSGVLSYTKVKDYTDGVIGSTTASVKSGILSCSPYDGVAWDSHLRPSRDLLTFVSPDMFYSSLKIQSGDQLIVQGRCINTNTLTKDYQPPGYYGSSYATNSWDEVLKYNDVTYTGMRTGDVETRSYAIDAVEFTTTSNPTSSYFFDKAYNDNYNHISVWPWGGSIGNIGNGESRISYAEAGTCYTLSIAGSLPLITSPSDVDYGTDKFTLPYAHIYRPNISRYGGYTAAEKEKTEYIPCTKIILASAGNTVAMGGDTYIGYFGYTNSIYSEIINDVSVPIERRLSNHILFPVESVVNLDLTYDINYFRSKDNNHWLIRENAKDVEITATGGLTFTPRTNLYQYNTVYSTEQNINFNYSFEEEVNTKYSNRVIYSDITTREELKDSWGIFRSNNYLDLDPQLEGITKLQKWNNEIYFFQKKGFGILPIEQRALVEQQSIGALQMGVAGILDYYKVLSEFQGLKYIKDITIGSKGLYWYDSNNKAIIRFDGSSIKDLTLECKINSYIKDLNLDTLGVLGYDYAYNEVLFKLATDKVLVFNEVNDKFIAEYTYTPTNYVSGNLKNLYYFTTFPTYNGGVINGYRFNLYKGGNTLDRNNFGLGGIITSEDNPYRVSSLTITDSDNYLNTKVYDNLKFYTECIDSSTKNITNNVTFDTLLAYDKYQYSGTVPLVFGSNLERKEMEYVLALPRNIVTTNGYTGTPIDITDPVNHNSSRAFKERFRDKTLTVELTLPKYHAFSIPYLTFVYRISNR